MFLSVFMVNNPCLCQHFPKRALSPGNTPKQITIKVCLGELVANMHSLERERERDLVTEQILSVSVMTERSGRESMCRKIQNCESRLRNYLDWDDDTKQFMAL